MKKLILIVCAAVFCAVIESEAYAGSATATWTHPTSYVDGSPLVATDISQTRLEYGSCSGTAFGVKSGETVVAGAATTATISGLAAGSYCFRAYTTAKGVESGPSAVASKTVPQAAPSPPTLTTISTVAYSVTVDWPNLAFVRSKAVGTVALGVPCAAAATDDGLHMIPLSAVKLTGANRPAYVVAACG